MGTWAGEGGNLTDSSYTKPQSTTTSWLSYSRPLNMLKLTFTMRMVILVHVHYEPHPINGPHLPTCFSAVAPSSQLVVSVENAPEHRRIHGRIDIARLATLALQLLETRPRQLQPRRYQRGEEATGGRRPRTTMRRRVDRNLGVQPRLRCTCRHACRDRRGR